MIGEHVQALHLLNERRHVLETRGRDLIAEVEQSRVVVRIAAGLGALLTLRRQVGLHAHETGLFFADDAVELGVRGEVFCTCIELKGDHALARGPGVCRCQKPY